MSTIWRHKSPYNSNDTHIVISHLVGFLRSSQLSFAREERRFPDLSAYIFESAVSISVDWLYHGYTYQKFTSIFGVYGDLWRKIVPPLSSYLTF